VDHTVDIEFLHCGRHYNVMEALPLLFFSQKVLLGVLSFLFVMPKVVGSPTLISLVGQSDPTLLGTVQYQGSLSFLFVIPKVVIWRLATRLNVIRSSFPPRSNGRQIQKEIKTSKDIGCGSVARLTWVCLNVFFY